MFFHDLALGFASCSIMKKYNLHLKRKSLATVVFLYPLIELMSCAMGMALSTTGLVNTHVIFVFRHGKHLIY